MKVASGPPRLKLTSWISSSSSSSSDSASERGLRRVGVRSVEEDLKGLSSSSVSPLLPVPLERRRRLLDPCGVAGAVWDALEGEARAGERTALRVRDGEGDTGSRGSGARVCLDGPEGVVVRASDELGGVGSPPGASSLA